MPCLPGLPHALTCIHWSRVSANVASCLSTFSTSARMPATKRLARMVDMVTKLSSRATCSRGGGGRTELLWLKAQRLWYGFFAPELGCEDTLSSLCAFSQRRPEQASQEW